MTATYCGEVALSVAVPGAALAASAGLAGIGAALPDLLARIAALQAFAPSDVSFSANLTLAGQITAGIQQAITLGLPVPTLAAQIAAVAALIGDLLASLTGIQGQLTIVQDFTSLLASAGIHVIAFTGTFGAFGSEVDAEISANSLVGAASGVVLLTQVGASWTAMQQVFKVTP